MNVIARSILTRTWSRVPPAWDPLLSESLACSSYALRLMKMRVWKWVCVCGQWRWMNERLEIIVSARSSHTAAIGIEFSMFSSSRCVIYSTFPVYFGNLCDWPTTNERNANERADSWRPGLPWLWCLVCSLHLQRHDKNTWINSKSDNRLLPTFVANNNPNPHPQHPPPQTFVALEGSHWYSWLSSSSSGVLV